MLPVVDTFQRLGLAAEALVVPVQQGTDRRTHYFGLVDDAGGANFMRGLASGTLVGKVMVVPAAG